MYTGDSCFSMMDFVNWLNLSKARDSFWLLASLYLQYMPLYTLLLGNVDIIDLCLSKN